jgi:hypothetical protein
MPEAASFNSEGHKNRIAKIHIMKLLLATALTLLLVIDPASSAEIKPEARSFDAFWIQFKAAVAKGDKAAIAEMTKFPFYGTMSKDEFIKKCGEFFDRKTQRCFSKAKPIKEDKRDRYNVFCGEEIFGFERVNGEYRFTDIGMND